MTDMMPLYEVRCTQPGCSRPAVCKIAARWSDGTTEELKTYALCCAECLPEAYAASQAKQAGCRTARGETLERPGIYELNRGRRDQQLQRRTDLERRLADGPREE
jgi:hypothetical protein